MSYRIVDSFPAAGSGWNEFRPDPDAVGRLSV
jgi:hypothetical protein